MTLQSICYYFFNHSVDEVLSSPALTKRLVIYLHDKGHNNTFIHHKTGIRRAVIDDVVNKYVSVIRKEIKRLEEPKKPLSEANRIAYNKALGISHMNNDYEMCYQKFLNRNIK
jgi:hypothetical protein